jgi:hypothetical protein
MTPNNEAAAQLLALAAMPVCRSCGDPSPKGDPWETCAECERILAMTDEEVLAECSPEQLGWARGFQQGLRIGLRARATETDQ